MTVYVLEAYNTDSRYPNDIRYREYTTSKTKADLFNKIPKIQFTDSGHGICFYAREHKGHHKELRHELSEYVFTNMLKLKPHKTKKPTKTDILNMLKRLVDEKCMRPIIGGVIPIEWAISDNTIQEAEKLLSEVKRNE
jgi:hypothetical protein